VTKDVPPLPQWPESPIARVPRERPKLIGYLTHPLGPKDDIGEMIRRQDNISNAVDWFRFLVEVTPWAIDAPWLGYLIAIDEEAWKKRALMDQQAILRRCDFVIACGHTVERGLRGHMRGDVEHARNRHIPVVDCAELGRSPPYERSGIDWHGWLVRHASAPLDPLA